MANESKQPDPWDEEAFRALYEKTARPLWAYIARLTQSPSVADDIVQQTYLNVLGSSKTRQLDPSHLKNYLFKTATNLARDHFKNVQKYVSAEDIELTVPPRGRDYDLQRILGQLIPRDRKLLLLAYMRGFSHKEIATILGYTAASVRPLLSRARDRLRELLEQHGYRSAQGGEKDES
jgi:RNA polymerase sigma-70 factor, ECF subfamily